MLSLVKGRARGAAPETLEAAITAAEEQAKQSRREAERLITASAASLDDDEAEDMLRQARSQERAARRAEARIPELREQLAAAVWATKDRAFQRYRRELTVAARDAIKKLEAAAAANIELAKIRDAASRELGNQDRSIPLLLYGGILMPDLVGTWRKYTERALQALEEQELSRPVVPVPANDPRPMIHPRPGPVVIARGEILSNVVEPAPAASAAPAAQENSAPAPPPAPKREALRPGPPREGERQLHILGAGTFSLPDGTQAKAGDRVNLPTELADEWLRRGVANPVDPPAEIPPVVGDAKLRLPDLAVEAR